MKRSIILCEPVSFGGKTYTSLDMRRPTMGDEEDAVDQAITLGKGDNQVTVELCLVGLIVGAAYDDMRRLPTAVYKQLRAEYAELCRPKDAPAPAAGEETTQAEEAGAPLKTPKESSK